MLSIATHSFRGSYNLDKWLWWWSPCTRSRLSWTWSNAYQEFSKKEYCKRGQCCWNVNSCKVKLIHFGRNLREKLWHLEIPKNVADQFVRDVMRSHHGGTYEGWLVAWELLDLIEALQGLKLCWMLGRSDLVGFVGHSSTNTSDSTKLMLFTTAHWKELWLTSFHF